jgi:hypothetical protein
MIEIKQDKLTQNQFSDYMAPMVLDLMAVFRLLEEDVQAEINKSVREGRTPDQLIENILGLF